MLNSPPERRKGDENGGSPVFVPRIVSGALSKGLVNFIDLCPFKHTPACSAKRSAIWKLNQDVEVAVQEREHTKTDFGLAFI